MILAIAHSHLNVIDRPATGDSITVALVTPVYTAPDWYNLYIIDVSTLCSVCSGVTVVYKQMEHLDIVE